MPDAGVVGDETAVGADGNMKRTLDEFSAKTFRAVRSRAGT
jgi:hypothetical protein